MPIERRFHGGDVYFAIALSGMSVAHFEKRAGRVHRYEERRAFY